MTWTRISLASTCPDDGWDGQSCVYELTIPLTADGRIDEPIRYRHPEWARIARRAQGEQGAQGFLVKAPRCWGIVYDCCRHANEVLLPSEQRLQVGKSATIIDAKGKAHPMRVLSSENVDQIKVARQWPERER